MTVEEQYDLELDEEVEIRSYTTTDEDGNTSTVYYEYRILNVTLTNYGLGNVIASSRLTAEQWERYKVLLETLGNRSYLFGEDVSSAPGGGGEYTDYDIPGEALTDTAFANMVREAEKYLGYPYVWGAELAKARKKKAEWDSRVKDLERRYREEENSEIHEMVHAANLTPDQLSELLKMFAEDSAPKPETIQSVTEEETTHEN